MAAWAVSLKHKHIGIRGGKTITEGGRDDRVTDKLSTGHLSHNVLQCYKGLQLGHLRPRIPLSIWSQLASFILTLTLVLSSQMIVTTLVHSNSLVDMSGRLLSC